jgi:hypothetical protein
VFAGWSGACAGTATTCNVTTNSQKSVTATFNLTDDNFPPNGQMPAGWSSPDVNWRVVANSVNDPSFRGGFSMKSGAIIDGQSSSVQVTTTVAAGTVDFAYKVSSEDFYDTFSFYIDDILQFPFPKSGQIGWTEVSIPVTAGSHVFKFVYQKDTDTTLYSDAAWIDSVVFPTGVSTKLLTVTGAGTGGGTVTSSPSGINCGSSCTAFFTTNSTVTLTATPAAGSTFVGWAGACTGPSNPCSVVMSAAQDVTATFNIVGQNTLSVSKAGTGGGTITSSPAGINCGATCYSNFPNGATVTLKAKASSSSKFTGWSGPCTGTGDCVVHLTQPTDVTAIFTLKK